MQQKIQNSHAKTQARSKSLSAFARDNFLSTVTGTDPLALAGAELSNRVDKSRCAAYDWVLELI